MSRNVLRCPDGSTGVLISTRPGVDSRSPDIHLVSCSDSSSERLFGSSGDLPARPRSGPSLLPRQAAAPVTVCNDSCETTCTTSNAGYNADECDSLSRWMWQRGGQFAVKPGERVVLSWGSCMYAFTNQRKETVGWCDSQWAQMGTNIARPCQANGTGGHCSGSGFNVEVLYNDGSTNTPIPYSSIIPVTSSASTTPSITTSAAAETQSVGQAAYTDLLPPSVPTPTNTGSSTTTSSADSSRMVPWLVGAIGGFTAILIFIALCYSMIWRRSKRHNAMRLASDDGHVKASNTPGSYGMRHIQGKFSQHNQFMSGSTNSKVSSKGETTTSVPPPAQHISPLPKDDANHTSNNSNGGEGNSPGGSRPPTGSRVATALSMYTLDLDPFRALKRVVSGRKKANDDGNLAVSAV